MCRTLALLVIVTGSALVSRADYTLPSFDLEVNLAATIPVDTSGVPVDDYVGVLVTLEWEPLADNARSDRAVWGLRVEDGDPEDPANWFADPGYAVDAQANSEPLTLHFFGHMLQVYDGTQPLELTAKQLVGGGALWRNVSITLVTSSPVPFAMEYLSIGTLEAGDTVFGDNSGAWTALYGKNGLRRDGEHEYYGGRWYMGWEDAGDDVYTLNWPGGDLQVDLVSPPDSADLDLFLWGSQTACLAYAYSQAADERIRIADLEAGTYYLHIDGWQGAAHAYDLTVSQGFYAPYVFSGHRNAFNNFGPGDTYRELDNTVYGLTITCREPPEADGWDQGPRFVPTTSGYVTEIVAATHMAAWNDDNIAEIWICANDSSDPFYPIGRPGDVLERVVCKEEMDIAAFPETTTPIYYRASGSTYLQAGDVYWLIASCPGPHHSDITWARNNQHQSGEPGTVGDYAAREGSSEPWMIRTDYPYPLPACRIVVADRAPHVVVGDCDCSQTVDFEDITFFIAAIEGESVWVDRHIAQFGMEPACPFTNCDINADGNVDFDDITSFVSLLEG